MGSVIQGEHQLIPDRKVLTGIVLEKKTWIFLTECDQETFLTGQKCSGLRSTWVLPICRCAILCYTGSCMLHTTGPRINGASTRCMILPTVSPIPLRRSRIPYVLLNLKFTGRSMTGLSMRSGFMRP